MGRIYTTLFLVFWYIVMFVSQLANDNWLTRIVVFVVSFPMLLFALYIIWIDSKLPKDQQFRYYNSEHYKKRHHESLQDTK